MTTPLERALREIADIGEGSRTANSLPHIAKIAREAIDAALSEQTERQGVMETETERMGRMMDQSDADKRAEIERLRKRLNYLEESPCANN